MKKPKSLIFIVTKHLTGCRFHQLSRPAEWQQWISTILSYLLVSSNSSWDRGFLSLIVASPVLSVSAAMIVGPELIYHCQLIQVHIYARYRLFYRSKATMHWICCFYVLSHLELVVKSNCAPKKRAKIWVQENLSRVEARKQLQNKPTVRPRFLEMECLIS